MRKWTWTILLAGSAAWLAGCGSKQAEPTGGASQAEPPTRQAPGPTIAAQRPDGGSPQAAEAARNEDATVLGAVGKALFRAALGGGQAAPGQRPEDPNP